MSEAKSAAAPSAASAKNEWGFPLETFNAFGKIMGLARDLNTQVQTPEVVFIGREGAGKTSLIESVLGFSVLNSGTRTKRALSVSLVCNPDCDQPYVTIKRDSSLKEFDSDAVVPIDVLGSEISRRSASASANIPIKIQIEYKNCWSMTFIETVGLPEKAATLKAEELEEKLLKFTKPSHRLLVFVEPAADWDRLETIEVAQKVDPKLERSYFVFTDFQKKIKEFTNSRDVNKFFSQTTPESRNFFVSQLSAAEVAALPPGKQRRAAMEEQLAAKRKQDLEILEALQFDRRFENRIGVPEWRTTLLDQVWKRYQETVPEVLKRLRAFTKNSEEHIVKVRTQLSSMDAVKLRALASNYVMEFLQSIEKLIVGTLEGNPALNGQTLTEEKLQDETGEWTDSESRPIAFEPATWNIPYWDSKLYGGQQFERLLNEFKAVSDHTVVEDVTMHDIATAAGPIRLTNSSNFAWTASDIAQKKSQAALMPLIEQLFKRANYVLKRLVDIVDKMMDNKRKTMLRRNGSTKHATLVRDGLGMSDSLSVIDIDDFPYFTHSVKDMYFKFVDQTSSICREKCLDEFFCTRLIHWELQNGEGSAMLSKMTISDRHDADTLHKNVSKLALSLFSDIRTRVTKNVLLKSYNYFLIPMQTDLWGAVQGKITTLSDVDLAELFEVNATKEKLKDDEKHLQQILVKFGEQEAILLEAANVFSHPFK